MSALKRLHVDATPVSAFCRRHGIRSLAFFGSVLRHDFGSNSDVDVLVEFEPDHVPGLLGLARMERELGELLGRRVDMNTKEDLSPYFRDDVLAEAELQYAAA